MGCNQSTAKSDNHKESQTPAVGARRDSIFSGIEEDTGATSIGDGVSPRRRKVTHICLTGGPCAGKSTALADLQTRFQRQSGIKVYSVPEAATLMVGGGMDWGDADSDESRTEYQLALLRAQLALEDTFLSIAKAYGKPAVVISDRGTMDGRAFCTDEQFFEVLRRGGYSLEPLRDRYDAVVHMVSAAKGASDHYNMDNLARQENIADAVIADDNLRKCYIGHSNIIVFDNSTNFQKKLDRVFDSVAEACGSKPIIHHRTRRYLTAVPQDGDITVPYVNVTVTVTILSSSTPELIRMVLKRKQEHNAVYFYQTIRSPNEKEMMNISLEHGSDAPVAGDDTSDTEVPNLSITLNGSSSQKIKEEQRISQREYLNFLEQRDEDRVDIVKDNLSFMHEDTYYEVGVIESPPCYKGVALMYVNHPRGAPLPPFLGEAEDVTDNEDYSSYTMSSKKAHASPMVTPATTPAKKSSPKPTFGEEEASTPKKRENEGRQNSSNNEEDSGTTPSPQRKHSTDGAEIADTNGSSENGVTADDRI